ncbi:hypothetical protein BC629DRAFT_1441399 [Irpex lacteus]|nr:hypothetical protein BC629DRAFT_1441399 [Irpex lacteus]
MRAFVIKWYMVWCLHGAVHDYVFRRNRVNEMLLDQIYAIYTLPGFAGEKSCGTRVGSAAPALPDPVPVQAQREDKDDDEANQEDIEDDIEDDDEAQDDIGGIIQYRTRSTEHESQCGPKSRCHLSRDTCTPGIVNASAFGVKSEVDNAGDDITAAGEEDSIAEQRLGHYSENT